MLTSPKFWLLLLIVGGLGGGYSYYDHTTKLKAAKQALQESSGRLSSLRGLIDQKKAFLSQNREDAEKNQVLLRAKEILDKRLGKINDDLKRGAESFSVAVEKARSSGAGKELGDLTLTNGKLLRGTKIRKVDESGISVMYAEGIGNVVVDLLPGSLQAKYDLGPNALIPKLAAALTAFQAPAPAGMISTTNAQTMPETSTASTPAASSASTAAPATGSSFDPSCLIIIKTDHGSGSGFIASVDGKTYVYTNAHVICGTTEGFTAKIESIKTASGRSIPIPYEIELSNTYDPNSSHGLEDVARFPVALKEGETSYALVDTNFPVTVNQKVTAYGNSLGGGAVTSLEGAVLGLGSDRIEVSCQIVPGNSGGPIILTDTMRVLGISTYLDSGKRDIWTRGTVFENVRRFAVRPDKVTQWRKMQYTSLMSSLAELKAFHRDTLTLAAACYLDPKPNRGGFDIPSRPRGDYIIRQVIVDGSRFTLGAAISNGIARVNQRLGAAKGTMAMTQAVPVFSEFFTSVAQTSSSQISMLSNADRAPYLKQFIPELLEIRKTVHANFLNEGATRYR
ncbi:MAG: trypsin-like peptidase domain-containing protein [Verrucomicrobia bacterium]|nr:trypsin-like peptidase domain-containing protein [Verrucomicrobiota bacterium]